MEYTYEFLRKCHGLRFRAKIFDEQTEGVVKVNDSSVALCCGEEVLGNSDYFHRASRRYLRGVDSFNLACGDFEIVPRDPETYQDWQVGDKVCEEEHRNACYEVIFRSGELVIFKDWNGWASNPMTCSESFTRFGMRLVLTDIEKQIIKERETAEWKPQNGDICFASVGRQKFIIIYGDSSYSLSNFSGKWELGKGYLWGYTSIRLATDEEKQRLFDALAKEGKRWNAEKKVVDDIPKPCEFKKFDPVLMRDGDNNRWEIQVFGRYGTKDERFPYFIIEGLGYLQCIPLNEKTMHLLGTSNNYEEEQS